MKKTNFNDGIFLGSVNNKHFFDTSNQHFLIKQENRVAQGTAFVMPNLLTYKKNMVVEDIKSEYYTFTSNYRKEVLKQKIFKIGIGDEIPEFPLDNFTIYLTVNPKDDQEEVNKLFRKVSEGLNNRQALVIGRDSILNGLFLGKDISNIRFYDGTYPENREGYIELKWGSSDVYQFMGLNIKKCLYFKDSKLSKRVK